MGWGGLAAAVGLFPSAPNGFIGVISISSGLSFTFGSSLLAEIAQLLLIAGKDAVKNRMTYISCMHLIFMQREEEYRKKSIYNIYNVGITETETKNRRQRMHKLTDARYALARGIDESLA